MSFSTISIVDAYPYPSGDTSGLISEGSSGVRQASFAVNRTGDLSGRASVAWAVTGADTDPADAADFAGGVLPSGIVVFEPGSASGTITVNVAGDTTFEPYEIFAITLSGPTNGAVLGSATARALIRNDDQTMSISAVSADLGEGDAGETTYTFLVDRESDNSVGFGAEWVVTGSGANPATAEDFVGGVMPSGSIGFRSGQPAKTISFAVAGDRLAEADEGFTVTLVNPTVGLTLLTPAASGVIRNDDPLTEPVRAEQAVNGGAGVDAARIEGGLRGAAVTASDGLPSRVTVGTDGPAYALSGVEVLDFADGRLVFDPSDPAAQVARLFEAALDRAPDQAGMNFYVAALQGGRSLADIATGFIGSPEFGARFGTGLNADEYVERLYANVLGRGASDAELAFYRAGLSAGLTREQVLVGFSESPENKARTADLVGAGIWDLSENAATAARLYDTMFGRLPDMAGLRFYRDGLDSGAMTPLGFVGNFLGSPEFAARYGGAANNAQLVDLLYRNTLDRTASASEMDYYVQQLDAGTLGRAQLVLNFSESPEHAALLAPAISSEDPAQFGILFA